jgi:hypothetical protein
LTSFVAVSGLNAMLASTKVFVAGPLPPGPLVPEVERVTLTEAGFALASPSTKCHVAVAFAVNTPADVLLIVTVHVAWLPLTVGVAHVSDCDDGAGETDGVIDVSDAVVPDGNALVVIVNTCWWPTSLVAVGAMLTFAST